MMRWLDRFHNKYPRLTMIAVIMFVFAVMYISNEIDRANSNTPRWQLIAARTA